MSKVQFLQIDLYNALVMVNKTVDVDLEGDVVRQVLDQVVEDEEVIEGMINGYCGDYKFEKTSTGFKLHGEEAIS